MGPCSSHAPTPLKGTGLLSLSLFVLLPGLAQPCHAHCAVLAAGRVAFRASCGLPGHNSSFCRHSRRVYCLVLRPSVLLTSRLEAETRLFCTVLAAEPVPQQCCPALPWDPRRRQCMARPEPRHRAVPRPPRGSLAPAGRLCHGALVGESVFPCFPPTPQCYLFLRCLNSGMGLLEGSLSSLSSQIQARFSSKSTILIFVLFCWCCFSV